MFHQQPINLVTERLEAKKNPANAKPAFYTPLLLCNSKQVEYAALNDHGYDWWTNEGKLVLEDPEYCASVSFTVGSWIEMLDKYSAG